ncbi:MAG: hypothetical protein H5T69_16375, partial [Chloroflexi bacterium]|nr:hypothetical protein [Chloroflexota bacterium]
MHTTTPTLTAAAQSLRGRPYVRCRFQDHVVRWMQLRDDPGAATPSDSAYTAVGGEGYLVRIRNNAGAIQALRTNAPTSAAHWVTGWSTIADGATSGADVALAVFSAGKLRAFYHKSGAVRCIESSDGGATWANDHVAVAGAVGSERLAADNDALFVQNAQITLYRNSVWSATSWSIIGAWAGRTWTSPQGIGAAWQAEESRWVLVAAGNGKITTLTYGADYGNDRSWRAGADQAPASGADPRCPDVTIASVLGEPLYLISWIDRYDDGVHAWEQPSVRQSFDCCHFGMELPLDLPAAVHQRCALVYDALGGGAGYLWCANERAVCQAYIPLNWYTPDYEPVAFGRSERIDAPGMLELEIVNPPVALVALDSWTEETHAYQPLAQVALKRGYQTSAGNEFINVSPYYIVRLAYRDGLEGGALVVRAVDGWGLLDLFTPDMPFTWRNRTIRWLLAELAAQVGLDYDDDGSSRLGVSLGEFTLHAGQTARSAVLALLGLARAGARWTSDARAKLYVFEL